MSTPALNDPVPLAPGGFYGVTITVSDYVFDIVVEGVTGMLYQDLVDQLNELLLDYATVTLDNVNGMLITATHTGVTSTVTVVDGARAQPPADSGIVVLPLIAALAGTIQPSVAGTYVGGQDYIVNLRWSNDGGHTWSNEMMSTIGRLGQTARRLMYRRLGSTSITKGTDRVFELSSTDPFPVALIAANMEASR